MRKPLLVVLGLLGLLTLGVWADNTVPGTAVTDESDQVMIIMGETENIPVSAPTKVGVADPKIADIVTVSEKNAVIMGKAKGRTNFFYTDNNGGEHSIKIKVIPEDVTTIAEEIKRTLKVIDLPDVVVNASQDQGKVMLLGTVRTVADKERLKTGLGELYPKTIDLVQIEEAALVEIAVEIVELSKGATKEMGFTVPRTFNVADVAPAPSTHLAQVFSIGALQRSQPLAWQLDLLEDEGKAKVLARPRLLCQSGKEASMMIGGEVPVFTTSLSSLGGQSTSVDYKSYGINLKISPTVTIDKRVQLALNFDISELGESDTIGSASSPTAKAFPLKKRTVSTSLHLEDGETMAIGGLIKQKTSEDLAKFPWLADIPVLGAFFRHRTTSIGAGSSAKDDIELFITLTPKIVYSGKPKAPKDDVIKIQQKEFVEAYARTDIPKELQDYVLDIQKRIIENIAYPSSLIGTGWEGTVVLKLNVVRAGKLDEAQMIQSSGYKIFDEEALKLVKSLTYPAFPFDTPLEQLKLEIPIVYREKR